MAYDMKCMGGYVIDKLASQLTSDKSLYQFAVHLYSRLTCDLLQLEFWLADTCANPVSVKKSKIYFCWDKIIPFEEWVTSIPRKYFIYPRFFTANSFMNSHSNS